jgi:hypothetical protein
MSSGDSGASTLGAPPLPLDDLVLTALKDMVSVVLDLEQDQRKAETVERNLSKFLESLVTPPQPPVPNEDNCDDPDPVIAPFCAQKAVDIATAELTFALAEGGAANDLHSAARNWAMATTKYNSGKVTAIGQLKIAQKAAIEAYNNNKNADSQSRNLARYFTLKTAIATALISFQSSMAAAGIGLATAAGTLIEAYVTYLTAAGTAEAVLLNAKSTAAETFWLSVEGARDQN